MLIEKWLTTFGKYLILMGRSFSRPERMRMFLKQYIKEMSQLGIDSIGIVLLISFFIGAVICIQMKLNMVGIIKTAPINSRMVLPLDILAMNNPTYGDQEIHHAQYKIVQS